MLLITRRKLTRKSNDGIDFVGMAQLCLEYVND